MYFFNIGTIGTFLFLSLGITFVLCCLLVYHFKRRLDLFEQKNDTIFELINNVLSEISNIKQKQNVLFMLAKNPQTENSNLNNSYIENQNKFRVKNEDEDEVKNEDEDEVKNEDEDEVKNEDEDETKNEDEDEVKNEDEDETKNENEVEDDDDNEDEEEDDDDEDEVNNEVDDVNEGDNKNSIEKNKDINIVNNDFLVFSDSEEIKKIKVVDDNDVIELTDENNENNEKMLLENFISKLVNNNSNLYNDFEILNFNQMQFMSQPKIPNGFYELFPRNQNDETDELFKFKLLDDSNADNLINIEEINDEYIDMPHLEPIELFKEVTEESYVEPVEESVKESLNESIIEPTVESSEKPTVESTIESIEEPTEKPTEQHEHIEILSKMDNLETNNEILLLNQPDTIEDSMSVISEDVTIWKKGEKQEKGYKKMNVQSLRDIVVSKGLVEDPSKLKKNELIQLLSGESL